MNFFDVIELLFMWSLLYASWRLVNKRKPNNPLDAERLASNLEIIKLMQDYAEQYPSQRFGQILRNIGIIQDIGVKDSSKPEWETPDYYIDRLIVHEESRVILERVKKELAEQAQNH